MGDLALVLAVVSFWAFVACVIALLVRYTASGRDDEEVACDLSESYYPADVASGEVAHAAVAPTT